MPSPKILAYEMLKQVSREYRGKNDPQGTLIYRMAQTGLNAPKFVVPTTVALFNEDARLGSDFIGKYGFHMPFNKLVVEVQLEDKGKGTGVYVFEYWDSSEESDKPYLDFSYYDWGSGEALFGFTSYMVWDPVARAFGLEEETLDDPTFGAICRGAVKALMAIHRILVQCRTRYTRYATRQRTSRKPLPEHWNAEPFYSYSVVSKDRFPNPRAVSEYKSSMEIHQRRHKRMGHFRRYKTGKVIWINEYEAGDARLGYKFKDYELQPPVKPH